MRKSIVFISIFLFLTPGLSNAQSQFSFGVKGGINFTGFHTGSSTFTSEFGINIGGLAEYSFSNRLSILGELMYNQKAGTIGIRNNNVSIGSIDLKLGYIDLPILAKVYLTKKLSFEIGPQIGFNISDQAEFNGSTSDFEVNSIDTAISGGFGFAFEKGIFIQARYSYGLSEVIADERYKNSVISLSLGYKFN